jgi:microcystin-dependent protein
MGGSSAASRITSTTFSPDGQTLGATGGAQTVTLTTTELPSHKHTGVRLNQSGGASQPGAGDPPFFSDADTSNTGSGGATNKMNPGIIANFIVKT